jgi:hypothetical protein
VQKLNTACMFAYSSVVKLFGIVISRPYCDTTQPLATTVYKQNLDQRGALLAPSNTTNLMMSTNNYRLLQIFCSRWPVEHDSGVCSLCRETLYYVHMHVLCTCSSIMYMCTYYIHVHVLYTCSRNMYMCTYYLHVHVLCTCTRIMYMCTYYVHVHVLCTCVRIIYMCTYYVHVHVLCTCARMFLRKILKCLSAWFASFIETFSSLEKKFVFYH